MIIASQEDQKLARAKALSEIFPKLQKIEFAGGQDNLKPWSGPDLAGETKGSAVL